MKIKHTVEQRVAELEREMRDYFEITSNNSEAIESTVNAIKRIIQLLELDGQHPPRTLHFTRR